MIDDHNLKISEPEYRDLDYPSYSLLSSISKQGIDVLDGVKGNFFQLKFGSLVDDMCFEPSKLKNYYHGSTDKPPTGNPKKITDEVLKGITAGVGDEQVSSGFIKTRKKKITENISDYKTEILAAARSLGVYKNYSEEKIMMVMEDKASDYFSDQLNSRGKIHIKPEMWAAATEGANTLKTHDFTKSYFVPGIDEEIFYQYKFVQEIHGCMVKGMLDCLVVDHRQKIIFPVDLKTGESPATMFDEVFLLHKYYLQAGLYRQALLEIVANDPDLEGYQVAPFEFVYLSKMNLYKPLIWVCPSDMHEAAFKGFTDRFGFHHKGLCELIELYQESKSGNFGGYTELVWQNDGRKMLNNLIKEVDD